jgi:uncharacterized damage-inducible protein DinB
MAGGCVIRLALNESLEQLSQILKALSKVPDALADNVYVEANIGKHLRHNFDHLNALKSGLQSGTVDYNHRTRDSAVERDRLLAAQQLSALQLWVDTGDLSNRALSVTSEISCNNMQNMTFTSNLHREILYMINHTIHHAAHIKLLLLQYGIELPESIGLAPGTATHLRQLDVAGSLKCAH